MRRHLHEDRRFVLKHSEYFCISYSRGDTLLSPSITLKYKVFLILREIVSLNFVRRKRA